MTASSSESKFPGMITLSKWLLSLAAMAHLIFLAGNQFSQSIPVSEETDYRIEAFSYAGLLKHLAFYEQFSQSCQVPPFREEESESGPAIPEGRHGTKDADKELIKKAEVLCHSWAEIPGFTVTVSPEFDLDGNLSRIVFNGILQGAEGVDGMLHQSLSRDSNGSLVMTIHHTEMPAGRRLAEKILNINSRVLKELSACIHNRTELEAVTNAKGLVGAWAWARLGMDFAPGESEKIRVEFRDYLKRLFPVVAEQDLERWMNRQNLLQPVDYAQLGELPFKPSLLDTIKGGNILKSPGRVKSMRHYKKYAKQPGKAFLSDPVAAITYFASKRVS